MPGPHVEMCTPETWRGGGVARSPSHESVTTELSLFSVSSAASDARVLRLLACKAGQGPDPNLRVASPNPDSKALKVQSSLRLQADTCRELLAGCAALCGQLGLRRSFSAGDVAAGSRRRLRSATSEVGLCAALEALTLTAASRSCSTWVAVGGSQLPSPQRSHPIPPPHRPVPTDNRKVRQNYIKRRLLTTYRALERMSQSEFNLDRLEQAAVASAAGGGAGPTTLAVPPPHARFVHPEAAHLALTAADLERERGRPLSKYERNMMIFNWLHTLDEAAPF
ncbi:uncharacterized protein LOC113516573 [Galleria mellonella]|uniref:Uncharacterized protein LOC113516573 n=1 Tax=Galleria mellonella TaxID=7137 RepID=A0ABM3MUT7_GALME|nr:uncharacterized protein LOC113516573 [Galleria mellonella]